MSGFIRPELRRALRRWAEPLTAGAVTLLGVLLFLRGYGRAAPWLQGLGGLVALGGALATVTGWQRARFRPERDGPGLVEVTERRITYYTRLGGGSIDIEEMTRLESRAGDTGRQWVLARPGRPPVVIPVEATGAEALFDAFAALPGMDTQRLLAARHATQDAPMVVWQRPARIPRLRAQD